jgi:hypothetical protein
VIVLNRAGLKRAGPSRARAGPGRAARLDIYTWITLCHLHYRAIGQTTMVLITLIYSGGHTANMVHVVSEDYKPL